MDNFRLLLFFALAFVLLLLYQAWMKDYGTPPQQEIVATTSMGTTEPVVVPETQDTAVPDVGVEASVPAAAPAGMAPMAQSGDVIHVQTDVLRVQLSTVGGSFRHLELLNYPVNPDRPDIKVQLFKPQLPNFYLAQSGFVGSVA
jgi:YidC/Oxa1 family membrane protein insertase